MLPDVGKEVQVAEAAVTDAAALLLAYFAEGVEVGYKGPGDVVTVADREAQQLVQEQIAAIFPDDLFVGEEGAPLPESAVSGRRRWYVDPLDGTTNFVTGRMRWAVSVAFCDADDRLGAAAVAAPQYGDVLSAVRGGGARRNGQALEPVTDLDPAQTVALFGPLGNLRGLVDVIGRHFLGVRLSGSTVSDLADLVCGRAGCYFGTCQGRWDLAAGALIAAESGLVVTDLAGLPLEGPADEVLVALPSVHAAVGPRVFEFVERHRQ